MWTIVFYAWINEWQAGSPCQHPEQAQSIPCCSTYICICICTYTIYTIFPIPWNRFHVAPYNLFNVGLLSRLRWGSDRLSPPNQPSLSDCGEKSKVTRRLKLRSVWDRCGVPSVCLIVSMVRWGIEWRASPPLPSPSGICKLQILIKIDPNIAPRIGRHSEHTLDLGYVSHIGPAWNVCNIKLSKTYFNFVSISKTNVVPPTKVKRPAGRRKGWFDIGSISGAGTESRQQQRQYRGHRPLVATQPTLEATQPRRSFSPEYLSAVWTMC